MNKPIDRYALALQAFEQQAWPHAMQLALQLIAHAPANASLHYIAGASALQLSDLGTAVACLGRAVELDQGQVDYQAQLARALVMAGRTSQAVAVADRAARMRPSGAGAWDTLGVVYSTAGAHERAAEAFEQAVRLEPRHANHRFNLGTSWFYAGRIDDAEREYLACVALKPDYWRAYLAIAQLGRQTPGHNHIALFQSLTDRCGDDPDARLHLHLALAKEQEDLGDTDAAFRNYTRGKAAGRQLAGDSEEHDRRLFDAIERVFEDEAAAGAPPGFATDEPIFVLGMPRSGTTLVDRILSSHSLVRSAGELGNFPAMLHRAGGRRAASALQMVENLAGFTGWHQLGQAYLMSTRPVTGQSARFIDKLPHNFLYAGFIARALPQARIICVRRDPMDTCLSNFRQLFAPDSPDHRYSFDLLGTGRYYLRFDRLMRFWQERLPGRILEVRYESLVVDQETETRRLLAHCDLSWEPACLSFEHNAAPAATASAAQVRRSMNRDSLHRWKRYEPHLGGLRRLLEQGGVRID